MPEESDFAEYVVLLPITPFYSRIERFQTIEKLDDVVHIGSGPHRGIIVRCQNSNAKPLPAEQAVLSFSVQIANVSNGKHSRERRTLRFWFSDDSKYSYTKFQDMKLHIAHEFFKKLLDPETFPRDYARFIKRLLKLMQGEYMEIEKLEVEMTPVDDGDSRRSSPVKQRHMYETSVWERAMHGISIDSSHVQEVLEHAYPAALSPEFIAKSLGCSEDEVLIYLDHLEASKVAVRTEEGDWLRLAAHELSMKLVHDPATALKSNPTVAIVTAQYAEKLAVDAMIENREAFARFDDAVHNTYTMGSIAGHRVVHTKLSAVGHDREARTAAGNATTRLLGTFGASVQHVLVVGVGGGVPHYTDAKRHVRLGDVVISRAQAEQDLHAYVYCEKVDRERETEAVLGFGVKAWSPSESDPLSFAADELYAESMDFPKSSLWDAAVQDAVVQIRSTMIESDADLDASFERPDEETDKLYAWVGNTNLEVSHPASRTSPRLHLGTIGAGREIVRDATLRSDFAKKFNVRAYDNEFDAVVESIIGNRVGSFTIVRGVSDYLDGTCGAREWVDYAALQAAAVARELIVKLPTPE